MNGQLVAVGHTNGEDNLPRLLKDLDKLEILDRITSNPDRRGVNAWKADSVGLIAGNNHFHGYTFDIG